MLFPMLAALLTALTPLAGGETVQVNDLEWTVKPDGAALRVTQTYNVRNRGKETTLVLSFPLAAPPFDDAFEFKVDHKPVACKKTPAGDAWKCSFFIDRGQPRRIDVIHRVAAGAPEPAPEAWTDAATAWVRFDARALSRWREGGPVKARVRVEIGDRPEHLVFAVPAGAARADGALEWSFPAWAPDLPVGAWWIDAPGPKFEGEAAAAWKAAAAARPSTPPVPEGDGPMPEWNAPTALLGRFESAQRRADEAILRGPCANPHRSAIARAHDGAVAQFHAFRAAMIAWKREAARQAASRIDALVAEAERLAGLAETCK
jgi:hypothetical protein